MLTKSILPIFIFFHALLALELAELVRPGIANDLSRRTVVAGGWPLFVDSCPSDTQGCNPDYCCPSSLECGGFNTKYCCPDNSDCLLAIETDPVCADTSWGLWNASGLLFCCLADQVGDTSGACESDQTVLPSSLEAGLLIPANTSAQAFSTSAATAGSSTGRTVEATTTTTGQETVTTTTNGGLVGKITSAIGSAIHSEAQGGHDLGVEMIMGILSFILSGLMAIF